MRRIKLPGKDKYKKILLIVLVIITIGVLLYQYNMKSKNIQSKGNKEEQQEVEKIIDKEGEGNKKIIDESNKNVINEDKKINKVNKEKKDYSKKENDLYSDAYTLFFSHEYISAISKANELISEFPSNAMGYNIRGIAKAYNGDFDGGMKDIDNSLEIDKNYGYARFNKALTYELYDNMDEALMWYNKALETEEYVWSYYGISSIYGRRGDIDNTIKYLSKAIQMDESVKEVAKTEQDFDPVKDFEDFKKVVYN